MTSVLERVRSRWQEKETDSVMTYRSAVIATANDDAVDEGGLLRLLSALDKDLNEFERDVDRLRRRQHLADLAAQFDESTAEQASARQKLDRVLAEKQAALDAVEQEFAPKIGQAIAERDAVDDRRKAAQNAQRELVDTAPEDLKASLRSAERWAQITEADLRSARKLVDRIEANTRGEATPPKRLTDAREKVADLERQLAGYVDRAAHCRRQTFQPWPEECEGFA